MGSRGHSLRCLIALSARPWKDLTASDLHELNIKSDGDLVAQA